ncbi:ATP-binding protein [Streptomyces albipurpureus]|uniref:ATP-binding protein n=1 Tax=Streptomyces albipurpureus TaxID=2897419 RepID=A0ABT0ULI5_9ACTN|nr:ATP-binding protein [Streptomyces sp. CWNU-1]MCM2389310.1 ATP-binding protein [Streptomyces sp. CWNU-1]
MKQSAAKSLGVVALGAALTAVAAGTAAAEPAAFPDSATSLDTVGKVVPVHEAIAQLPAGAEVLAGGQAALIQSTATLPGTLQGAGQRVLAADAPKDVVGSLIGGLPVGQLTKALPTGGLPVGQLTKALPTGGLPGLA